MSARGFGLPVGLAVAAAVAAAVVAGVLLATEPWSGEETAAVPVEYGVCNVAVRDIPDGVEAYPFPFPEGGLLGAKWAMVLRIPGSGMRFVPELGYTTEPDASGIAINAATGEVIFETYYNAEHEAKLKAALATLVVRPWEPPGPAWPLTHTPPTSEMAEILKPVRVASDYGKVLLKYRLPEAGSGMLAGPSPEGQTLLKLETCRSDALIKSHTVQAQSFRL